MWDFTESNTTLLLMYMYVISPIINNNSNNNNSNNNNSNNNNSNNNNSNNNNNNNRNQRRLKYCH